MQIIGKGVGEVEDGIGSHNLGRIISVKDKESRRVQTYFRGNECFGGFCGRDSRVGLLAWVNRQVGGDQVQRLAMNPI